MTFSRYISFLSILIYFYSRDRGKYHKTTHTKYTFREPQVMQLREESEKNLISKQKKNSSGQMFGGARDKSHWRNQLANKWPQAELVIAHAPITCQNVIKLIIIQVYIYINIYVLVYTVYIYRTDVLYTILKRQGRIVCYATTNQPTTGLYR